MQNFVKWMLTGLQKCRYKFYGLRFELRRKNIFDVLHFRQKSNLEVQLIDNIPLTYSMVYRIGYQNYLRMLQFGNLFGFSVFLLYLARHYDWKRTRQTKRKRTSKDSAFGLYSDLEYDGLVIGALFWMLLQWRFSLRHPLRIYFNQNTNQYLALFYTSVPFRPKQLHFERNAVQQMPDRFFDLDPFKSKKFILNKSKRFYMFEQSFIKPIDYNVLVHNQNYSKASISV